MLRLCLVIACVAAFAYALPHRNLGKVLNNEVGSINVTNGGVKGTWRKREMCPTGTYAIGFEMCVS